MVIRQQQMETFSKAAERNFENEMCEHLMTFSPLHCGTLGEPVIRRVVRTGMARAEEYGFTNRGPVRFYIELMIQLGTGFDTDPQLQWASTTLRAADPASQDERAELLYRRAVNYLDAVFGPRYEYEKQSLGRAERLTFDDLLRVADGSADTLLQALAWLHPQKMAYAGKAAADSVIELAAERAREHGLGDQRGHVVLAGLMYAFGHRCLTDPQFPWIASSLTDKVQRASGATVEYLFVRGVGYARESLAALEVSG